MASVQAANLKPEIVEQFKDYIHEVEARLAPLFQGQIFGAIAEYEKTMIVLKLRGARQRARARDGRCEGAKPFGPRPGEAEVLARIKAMQAAGETGYTIANRLNAEGVAPRRGKRWHPYAVDRIIARASPM
jgi:hypothetical protein